MKRIIGFLLLSFGLLLSGCVEIKDHITFNADGSGESAFSLLIYKDFIELVPQMKMSLAKEFPRANVSVEDDESGNKAVVGRQPFKNISEYRNSLYVYKLTVQNVGSLRKQYAFEALRTRKRLGPAVPVPVEIMVTFPGSIEATNGEKVDSRTVRWQWVAGPGGEEIGNLTATATAMSASPLVIGVGAGIVVLLLLAGGVFLVWRRKKPAVASGPSQPVASSVSSAPEDAGVFCTECGARQPAAVKFCTSCGHRMDVA